MQSDQLKTPRVHHDGAAAAWPLATRADSLLDQMWRLSDFHKMKRGGGENYADRS
jgi:hypothetical protein